MTNISWTGVDRAGTSRGGRSEVADVPAFVKQKYDSGWRLLTVRLVATDGLGDPMIGEIIPDPNRSNRQRLDRTWWADGSGILDHVDARVLRLAERERLS